MNLNRYNKKKKNITNYLIIFFILLFFILCILFIQNNTNNFLKKNIIVFFNYLSENYDYKLKKIEINKLSYIDEEKIKKFFDDYRDNSIFLIPIEKILDRIKDESWVKEIKIKSNYKDTLKITIVEFTPRGIYNEKGKSYVFNNQGKVIDYKIQNHPFLDNLIIFHGENALIHSISFLNSIPLFLVNQIKEAIFVSNRRWDVELKNGIILKLKENDLQNSFINYEKIYKNMSNQDLREIKSIDLRVNNRAILKFRRNND